MSRFTSTNQPEGRGRPKGTLNKATQLLREATPEVLESLIKSAKDGDTAAANTVLKHSLPPVKAESRWLALEITDDMSLSEKAEYLVNAALTGKCCPSVASQLLTSLNNVSKIKEIDEIIERLNKLEAQQ